MRLNEYFECIGEPYSYFPGLVKAFGISVNASVFLSFIGWKTLPHDIDGWKAVTTVEIEARTGLSTKEQATARRLLVEKGLIEEHYARLQHTLKFRLTSKEMGSSPNAEREDAPIEHTPKGKMAIHPNGVSSKEEVITNKKTARKPLLLFNYEIPKTLNNREFLTTWIDWIKDKSERKQQVTARGAKLQLESLEALGSERAIKAIRHSIQMGYHGIFEPSGKKSQRQQDEEDINATQF